MNWFSSSGFLKAAVESATSLTKSLIQDDYIEDSDADDSPAVPPRLRHSISVPSEEEESVGITPQLIEFVTNVLLYPKTFTDFPLDAQLKDQIILAEWQEKHARLIIQRVPELDAVRFKLCPTKMPDNAFWHIYFILVRTKLGDKLLENTAKKPTPTNNQNVDDTPKPKKSSNSNPSSPTVTKIPSSLLLPLSPILDLINTNENNSEASTGTQDLEEYFENLWRDELNSSLESLEQHPNYIDPEKDNYFVMDISFDDFVNGKVTSYPPSPKKLSPRPKNEKGIPSKAAKVIRSLANSLMDVPMDNSSTDMQQPSATQELDPSKSTSETLESTPEPEEDSASSTPEPTQQEQTTQQQQSVISQEEHPIQDTSKELEVSQNEEPAAVSTQATNESLQDVISSLMQDDGTSAVPSTTSPTTTTTTTTLNSEQDDDSFMNWQ